MRKPRAPQASTVPAPTITFSPLTELQQIAGEPLKGTTADGREILFGQIMLSDLSAFEVSSNLPLTAIFDPTYRATAWGYLVYRSMLQHDPSVTPADVDKLFPPTGNGLRMLGEVVAAVLPRDEEPAEDPAGQETGDAQ